MKMLMMLAALTATLWLTRPAAALNASEVRGGWETTLNGVEHIYQFKVRGDRISGIACGDCEDATTLAFLDGTLGPYGLSFVVTHVRDDGGTAYQDHVTGMVDHGELTVKGTGGPGGGAFTWTMHKDQLPPMPRMARAPAGARPAPPPYQAPGPWEQLSDSRVAGVWLTGAGTFKQFFIIRKVGDQLLGMLCGPCNRTYFMEILDDFAIRGDTLTFNVLHEEGRDAPYYNRVTAHVARNEMRLAVVPTGLNAAPLGTLQHADMTLLGPVSLAATAAR
ncbi:MAG TPA: hypothetical protein VHX52_06165 [Steroidobacteraceae bacterium]|jgi:hypothetical protein|nr:hypothetical protein [Steroidobacteraceae bacterium]